MKYLLTSVVSAAVMVSLGLFSIIPSAQAAAQVLNIPFSFTSQGPEGCANEIIQFSGTEHLVSNIIQDQSGGLHINLQANEIGTGIGQTTGDKYITLSTGKVLSANEHIAVEFTVQRTATLIGASSGIGILGRNREMI